MSAGTKPQKPLVRTVAFTVIVDTREQTPFTFEALRGDAKEKRRPLVVPTVRACLGQGDYSIYGHENAIAIERKSLCDLFNTLGQGRDRFIRELERLATLAWAAVVVEADWPTVLESPPPFSLLRPKTVYRSVIAWQQRFPRVHWWMCPGRAFAEVTTFRILERFWIETKLKERNGANAGA